MSAAASFARVFLSYSTDDAARADELTRTLEAAGHEVWTFREDIDAGVNWVETMIDAVIRSDVVVFLCSPSSVRSRWCRAELECARERRKKVVVVQAGPECSPDGLSPELDHLRELQWVSPAAEATVLLDAVRTDFELVRELTVGDIQATEWIDRGRPRSVVPRGAALVRMQELADAPEPDHTPSAARPSPAFREFVRAGQGNRTRTRRIVAVLSALLLIMLAGAVGFGVDSVSAEGEQRRATVVQQLRSEAARLAARDPARSLRLHRAAAALAPDSVGRARLTEALLGTRLRRAVSEPGNRSRAVAYSRDGTALYTGGSDGILRVYRGDAVVPVQEMRLGALISDVVTARGSDVVVTMTESRIQVLRPGPDGTLRELDGSRSAEAVTLRGSIALASDGSFLVAGGLTPVAAVLEIAPDGALSPTWDLLPEEGDVRGVDTSDDGRLVAVSEGGASASVGIFDLTNLAEPVERARVRTGSSAAVDVVLGPGARTIAISDERGGVTVHDLTRDDAPLLLSSPANSAIGTIALLRGRSDADPPVLAAVDRDGSVGLWTAGAGTAAREALQSDRLSADGLAVSPEGDRLAVAGEDGRVTEWLTRERGTPELLAAGTAAAGLVDLFPSPMTGLLGYAEVDTPRVTFVNVADGSKRSGPSLPGRSLSIGIDDDGTTAMGRDNGLLASESPRVTGLRTGSAPDEQSIHQIRFGAGGTLIGTENEVGPGFLWRVDANRLTRIGTFEPGPIIAMSFAPDGRWVAAGDREGLTRIFEIGQTSITKVAEVAADDDRPGLDVAWYPDGRHLAVRSPRGLRVVDMSDPAVPVVGGANDTESTIGLDLAILPDRPIMVGAGGGAVTVRDITDPTTPSLVGARTISASQLSIARFSSDGRWLATSGETDSWQLHDLRELIDIASDPLPGVCLATAGTSLPDDVARTVASFGADDPCDL